MRNRTTVMVSIVLAMLVASMDTTIANTTMPIIVDDIGGNSLYAWVFTSYMVLSTVLAPLAGRISDLFGRKRIFATGIVLFLGGSVLCGLSHSMLQLIIFRAIQGIGAGVMMPFPSIIAGDIYPVEQRGKVQAFFTGMWGLSAILAPTLGTFFVTYLSWRWIFFVNIPICLISLLALLPYKEVYQPKKAVIDYWGALLFACGISSLLLTTVVHSYTFIYEAIGVILLIIFFLYEKGHAAPIVPLNLMRNRPVALMIGGSFLSCAALFGTSSFIPLFLQNQGHSLFVSGIALLSTSIGWMVVAVPSGKWVLRFGYKPLLIAGHSLLVVTAVLLFFIREGTSFGYIFGALTMLGLSFGLLFTVSTIGAQQLVEAHQKGISTSLQLFARNIGTAVSVTVMGAIVTQSDIFYEGIHKMFVYGLLASIIAFAVPFAIRAGKKEQLSE
ncbi:major facilitator superfamily transporter [Paenibacillus pectinilyticus]|uniref:MFS-type drug efflux transporter P55 n=1 Tax=Paenibacillus pectinilyticus TaxID=512399 RepID=A0A1C0ZW82_9BACL|nr:MFS transporter [Paenibacillus pectinilyticus]OCT12360.1 major facilitator superfamily transporter [Paenibacillus pectinilyticus]